MKIIRNPQSLGDLPTPHYCDNHIHTSKSDGRYDADSVIIQAKEKGITSLCITDHNQVNTDAPAQMARHQVEVIPGAEFSCIQPLDSVPHEIHIIGWNVQPHHPAMAQLEVHNHKADRRPYLQAILDALDRAASIHISYEELAARFPQTKHLGRQHIAQLLVEKGVVSTAEEAFARFIGGHGQRLAYVSSIPYICDAYASMEQVVWAIHQAQGIAILCHLTYYRLPVQQQLELLAHFKQLDGDGLECDYGHYDEAEKQREFSLAREFGLCPSCGSDFHGYGDRFFKQGDPAITRRLKQCWQQRYGQPFQNQSLIPG